MAVQGGAKCVKYLMFIFNAIFFIIGLGVIIAGALTLTTYNEYVNFTTKAGQAIPIVLICVGVFIFLTGFFGCCGAMKENYCMLGTYAFIMVVLLIVELAAGIAGYALRDDIESAIDTNMSELMDHYNATGSNSTMDLFDFMQSELECCGAVNYTDWFGFNNTFYNMVPISCCISITEGCNMDVSPKTEIAKKSIYTEPCSTALQNLLLKNIVAIAGFAIAVAVVELFGIIFACCLMRAIKSEYEVV